MGSLQEGDKQEKDRKSGSAGMPRPNSYAVSCLKKKKTKHRWFKTKHRWFEMKHRWFKTKHRWFETKHRWFETKLPKTRAASWGCAVSTRNAGGDASAPLRAAALPAVHDAHSGHDIAISNPSTSDAIS